MIRLLHISDLHFGTVDSRLPDAVEAIAARLPPDAVIVSGDLTQRARRGQFDAAAAWLRRLPAPVLCVPGNHDAPLYNLVRRLAAPFAGYRRAFGPAEPGLTLPGVVVQGVNTANPLVWKSGLLRRSSAARLAQAFAAAPAGALRIAVLHHAPVPAADGTPADMADPPATLDRLAATGAEVVLSGHTHMPHSGIAGQAQGMLFLQAGTAISTRRKTGSNDLSVIEVAGPDLTLTSWVAPEGGAFAPRPPMRFRRQDGRWQALSAG